MNRAATKRGDQWPLFSRSTDRRTPLSTGDVEWLVPGNGCPILHGALIAKGAAATDSRTARQPRPIQDVAFLLSLIEDPVDFAVALTEADRATLTAVAARKPNMPTVWDYLDQTDRSNAEAAPRLMAH